MLQRQRMDYREQQLPRGEDSTAGGPVLLEEWSAHSLELSLSSQSHGWGLVIAGDGVLSCCCHQQDALTQGLTPFLTI